MGLTAIELEALRARLRPEDRDRLRPDGLLEPVLPPLTLCGGLEAPYLLGHASLLRTVQKPAVKLSPKTVAMLRDATPEQREQAIKIASKLLARKATRAPTKD